LQAAFVAAIVRRLPSRRRAMRRSPQRPKAPVSVLIVTNGDVAGSTLATLRPEATVLPWRDILHEGPVPESEDAADLRRRRASYLASTFRRSEPELLAEFERRDAVLAEALHHERIELWFEHDLADQLQLLQVLDALAELPSRPPILSLQARVHLGPLSPERLGALAARLRPVEDSTLEDAARRWAAFREPTPADLADYAEVEAAGLPFMGEALRRALEELPRPGDGLSRTDRQILYSIGRGVDRVGMLFARVLAMEEAAFLGDWSFFRVLSELAFARPPLIVGLPEPFGAAVIDDDQRRKAFVTARVSLTEAGRDVLAGRADRVSLIGIDRWLGGTRVAGPDPWRYDPDEARLIEPEA
jgi:hypothetical protein